MADDRARGAILMWFLTVIQMCAWAGASVLCASMPIDPEHPAVLTAYESLAECTMRGHVKVARFVRENGMRLESSRIACDEVI